MHLAVQASPVGSPVRPGTDILILCCSRNWPATCSSALFIKTQLLEAITATGHLMITEDSYAAFVPMVTSSFMYQTSYTLIKTVNGLWKRPCS